MKLPEARSLRIHVERSVLHVTLQRPEVRNAMNAEMLADIEAVFASARDEPAIRVIVLRGAGGHFCAGADLKSMMGSAGQPNPAADPVAAVNRRFGTMLRTVSSAPQVVVVACEGAVLGGGFGIVCVSDIALAHADARFGMPETTRGLPPAQIAPFVVERIGLTQARRIALTGAQFGGDEALALGLVHYCCTDREALDARLATVLDAIRSCGPESNRLTKQILLNVGRLPIDEVLDDAATKFAACAHGTEAAEGIAAFLQKRKPSWAVPDGQVVL